jgi:hypothetical protein
MCRAWSFIGETCEPNRPPGGLLGHLDPNTVGRNPGRVIDNPQFVNADRKNDSLDFVGKLTAIVRKDRENRILGSIRFSKVGRHVSFRSESRPLNLNKSFRGRHPFGGYRDLRSLLRHPLRVVLAVQHRQATDRNDQREEEHFPIHTDYVHRYPCGPSGNERIRRPVAAKIALAIAGGAGGNEGSPRPVGG